MAKYVCAANTSNCDAISIEFKHTIQVVFLWFIMLNTTACITKLFRPRFKKP